MVHIGKVKKTTLILGYCVPFFVVAGCSNFENPITWDESIRSNELIGEWATVEGSEEEYTANISNGLDGLEVELTYQNERTKKPERASFTGRLRSSDDLDVLEVDMYTYQEQTDDGKTKNNNKKGYFFVRIELDGNRMLAHYLSVERFGEIAESVLQGSKVQMDVREVSDCVATELQADIAVNSLPVILRENDWDRIASMIQLSGEELEDFRERIDGTNSSVDPFKQVNSFRDCVAKKLPSEMLERVFETEADTVFAGERHELVRM